MKSELHGWLTGLIKIYVMIIDDLCISYFLLFYIFHLTGCNTDDNMRSEERRVGKECL